MLDRWWWFIALLLLGEEKLFVIGKLNDARNVENFLQISCEDERNKMAEMEGSGRGPTASVEVEFLACFVVVEEGLEIAMGEEDTSSQKEMRTVAGEGFEAGKKFRGDGTGTELGYQLVVVDDA